MKTAAPPPPRDSLILRVFCAFAVLLAAILGTTTTANAQEAQPARAQVYSVPGGTFDFFGGTEITLSSSIADMVVAVRTRSNFDIAAGSVFQRRNAGDSTGRTANGIAVGAMTISFDNPAEPLEAGDLLSFQSQTEIAATEIFRVYVNAAGDFAVAAGEATPITAALAPGEFFLLTTGGAWTPTTDAVEGTQGYIPAVAASATDDDGGNPGGDNDSNARDLAVIGLGVGVVGFMAAYLSGGDFSLFNFAPDYGYSLTESGYSVNTGGRLNFRKDGWHLYYAAGQTNANGEFGDFRYESGGEYTADLWTAAFSETVQGETADYDFSLSADYKGGIWRLSPTYRLHTRLDENETETANSLNLESVLRYNRWTIRPSAGFRWESADEFGDNARFNLSAVRRF
ncbi:MAG: hypothetical protein ACR2QC_11605 [Gammaproteobacteria bacterium]